MRNHFARLLTGLAASRPELVLLSGDIGNRLFDGFKAVAGDRFINGGVAEANLVGVAAGLAAAGLRPVCYTIAPFLTTRVIEQIRLDLAYHRLPVVLAGTGAGLGYASLGPSHQALEDIGMLRLIPGLTILAPADEFELERALAVALANGAGPVYLRLGKKGEPRVHARPPDCGAGRGVVLCEGRDAFLLAAGTVLPVAVAAAELLRTDHGLDCGVASLFSLKPVDEGLLARAFGSTTVVATVEEHAVTGGLGSIAAEWLARQQPRPSARLLTLGTPDAFPPAFSGTGSARAWAGLTPAAVAASILAAHSS